LFVCFDGALNPFKPWPPLALGLFFMSQPPIQPPPQFSAADRADDLAA
jgi:hypothetical protein